MLNHTAAFRMDTLRSGSFSLGEFFGTFAAVSQCVLLFVLIHLCLILGPSGAILGLSCDHLVALFLIFGSLGRQSGEMAPRSRILANPIWFVVFQHSGPPRPWRFGAKMTSVRSRWAQHIPKMAPRWHKMSQDGPKTAQHGTNMAPRDRILGFRFALFAITFASPSTNEGN